MKSLKYIWKRRGFNSHQGGHFIMANYGQWHFSNSCRL